MRDASAYFDTSRDVLSLTSAPALPDHEIEIEIAAIDVVDRLRLVDRAYVEMLAASISESYLHQPIAVASTPGAGNRYVLVDGENRLEAFKLLGRTTIPARIRDLTEAERRKHEIHANLIRNELTALDRTVFVGELASIFTAENADARHGGDRKSKKWREKNQFANLANWSSFSKEAARRTGLSTRSIDRTRDLFGKLSPRAIAAIRGTKVADNQAQLQALAELEPDQQAIVAGLIASKAAGNVKKAREVAGFVPEGGAVREPERLLAKIEPMLPRMSLADLQALVAMAQAQIAAKTPPAKPGRAKKGGAE
ncbi:ParB/RepB/Spo0J family partition protein [Bosea thiooxidans]|nr:ParB N-terminal domain-containing protein [Bosea sp. (in: a-proteobacteria)]